MEPEEARLERARKKDHTAFAELVHQYQGMVYSIAYHVLHHKAAAEELAQEVFLQLYRNLEKMETPDHLVFWLRRITCHRSIDAIRRQQSRKLVSLEELPEMPAVLNREDPWLAARLHRLLAALPEKSRIVVTLRYQEDLLPAEIAAVLDIPVNTVKSQLCAETGAGHNGPKDRLKINFTSLIAEDLCFTREKK